MFETVTADAECEGEEEDEESGAACCRAGNDGGAVVGSGGGGGYVGDGAREGGRGLCMWGLGLV